LKRRSSLVLLLLAAAGCARTGPVPTHTYYRLTPPRITEALARPLTEGVLFVGTVRSDGLSGERPLAYSEDPHALALKQYHYHHWEDAPPRLLRQQLVLFLREAKAAGTVIWGKETRSDQVLRGRLRRFEHVLRSGAPPLARVALELRLEDNDGRTLLVKEYETEKPATGNDVESAVAAVNAAVNDLFERFLVDAARAASAASAGL